MKKDFLKITAVLSSIVIIAVSFLAVRFFAGEEDTWICVNNGWIKHGNPIVPKPQTGCGETKSSQKQTAIPAISEEDVIRTFFNLINEKRIPEAIEMMDEKITSSDSKKQEWGVYFNNFTNIDVKKVEAYDKKSWTEKQKTFQVSLIVSLKPEATKAPIPNYGFESGENIRFINLVKSENNLWKIEGIATGP